MDLKTLLGEPLFSQVQAVITKHNESVTDNASKVKLVDLSEGGYVSKDKHTDKISALQSQIDDYKAQVSQRDTDLKNLQEQLKKADPEKLSEVTQSLIDLQAKYDQDSKDWQKKLESQAYEFMVKEKAGELTFSSVAAKKEFIREAIEKGFKVDGENLLGYGDWLKAYQEADPGAFKASEPAGDDGKKPTITKPANPSAGSGSKLSLSDMMAAMNKDPNFVPKFD